MSIATTNLIEQQAIEAKKAAKILNLLSTEEKNEAILHVASMLKKNANLILKANKLDLIKGEKANFTSALIDRLTLTHERINDFADGLCQVAELEDPTGIVKSSWTLENGLKVDTVTVPLGVIGMIYEARPNVTVDATGLALKSGNAVILKGGSSALESNKMIVQIMHNALEETRIPKEAVQFISSTNREVTKQLFTMKEHIDVLIPRGGASLISAVVNNATVPVLETGVGNCHIYIDANADINKALPIFINAKTDRPAVCNAAETLIVHEEWFNVHHKQLFEMLKEQGIDVFGDEAVVNSFPMASLATEKDWAEEYLGLGIAIKTVKSVDEAIDHIDQYGTKHSEAVITDNAETAKYFMSQVDAAAIYHNASTRFTDGGALGFGAEIGISTQKLHARGPMGLPALTTVKYLMSGTGQIRE
ncbi:glutamate-5-semialdehyde dehydrogenase [Bacillus suaedaesalsae]|uniref:Gamma-glutamyl phosphate reductase n=1 Tax=Bacillus suaedaesalsae TaxID=2810349 RepID=A0ABS2DIW9_9BACI|nr:glutamate-5-semialdehyde dehydrogenase [Bacillus suaedaesalsae]MBM6618331.1 glutamate-5-semialdehyde dehydrogenase [Bacillus suaedaesalsae]